MTKLKSDSLCSMLISFGILIFGLIIGKFYELEFFLPILIGGIAIFFVILYLALERIKNFKLNSRTRFYLIMMGVFLIRLSYIIYSVYYRRQHDVSLFNYEGNGHAGYIEYLYTNLHLPDFNPRTVYQFYHPPLSHIISASWLIIQEFFGISHENAIEGLQFLPLLYSMLTYMVSYKIFCEFGLKDSSMSLALLLVGFCPTFIIMSGSINNDILSILFSLVAVLYTIRWCRNQSFKNIIFIALSLGLGMFTKLSVALLAVPIGVCFLYVFLRSKDKKISIFGQFVAFGSVCVPIGLYWSVRNFLLYDMPLNYVPRLSNNSEQYVGNIPALNRLFDFSFYQFKHIYVGFAGREDLIGMKAYNDFNPTISLLKTTVFGEFKLTKENDLIFHLSYLIFALLIVLVVFSLIGAFVCLIRNKEFKNRRGLMFVLLYSILSILSYYYFSFSFPHTCSMNIRYCTVLIVFSALFIGVLYDKTKNNYAKGFLSMIIKLSSLVSVFLYFCLGVSEVSKFLI